MSDEVLEQLIKSYMATEQPVYNIGWQGGEPTLMGTEFFRKVVELQQKYGRSEANVSNGLQTNCTLINNEMARHLREYNFLVGCSVDGPADIHDHYRHTVGGQPTHTAVMRGIEALKRNHVEFNILTLVSQSNVRRAKEVYRYLVDNGYNYHQYIPCVEFDADGKLLPFAITGKEWGEFMCEIFDQWYPNDSYKISVRHFDSTIMKLVNGQTNVCCMARDCRQYFVVEHNGDIYPCDFYVRPELKLGNIFDTTWQEAQESKLYHDFGTMKTKWHSECDSCDCLDMCSGDCLKHRFYAGHGPENLSFLCEGWKRFIRHTREPFEKLAAEVKQRQQQEEDMRRKQTRQANPQQFATTNRNDPCPCGSGKKFKKCCGK